MLKEFIALVVTIAALILLTINNDDHPPECLAVAQALRLAGCPTTSLAETRLRPIADPRR